MSLNLSGPWLNGGCADLPSSVDAAGVHSTWIKLADIGIHGDGHMMMLEKNKVEIAEVMRQWLAKSLPVAARKTR
jgi:hypothetical protein